MPSEHKGTLSVVGTHVRGVFNYDNVTHIFEGNLSRPSPNEFPVLPGTLMLGGPALEPGPINFNGDFGPGGIVIAMDSISASINAQLPHDIQPYNISGGAVWIFE